MKTTLKILSIIPARGGSKGIPMKNIKKIANKPLIAYTIDASLNSKVVDKTIVSTDNEKIANIAKKYGAEIITRPKKLSTDKMALEPVVEHVLEELNKFQNYEPDLILILQNTSPLRNSKHVREAIQLFLEKKYDSMLSGFSLHTFLWKKKKDSFFSPVSYNPKNRPNRQDMNKQFFENGAIFISTYDAFKKSKCRISGKIGFYEMSLESSYNIDTKKDLEYVKKLIKKEKNE
jgi:CMP-N,N'-diacetyllegionaminic acid synthase